MKRVATEFPLRLFTENQKRSRLNACRELKEQLEIDPDLFPSSLMMNGRIVVVKIVHFFPRDKVV